MNVVSMITESQTKNFTEGGATPVLLALKEAIFAQNREKEEGSSHVPALLLIPSLPGVSPNVLESSFLATTHRVIASANMNWKSEWPLYLTLGAGIGLILEGFLGLIANKRLFFPLLFLLPLSGILAAVAAGTSFFKHQPTTLVAIADLAALGVQLFTILAFASVYLLRRSTIDKQNSYYSKIVQYEF